MQNCAEKRHEILILAQRNGAVQGDASCMWNAAAGILDGFRVTGGPRASFYRPPEDSPPGAKDKAPGEKQMPPAPYVPLAVASESA